jgi:signal transduction histidine kinase
MSYELRTPLTSIGGFAELLGGGYAGELSSKGTDYVGAILESVDRLSKLINDVLDLTTGEARGVPLEKERVDVAGLCRAAVDTAKLRAAEKGQKLDAEISPSAAFVFGDARRLRESVEHVLQNAIGYSDRKARITLSADGDKKQAVIRIRDNGPGIAPDDLPRVFDRFHSVNEAGFRGEAALGLGLPLTRQFIEAHGGTVDLESKKGKGTTVTLTIPRGSR